MLRITKISPNRCLHHPFFHNKKNSPEPSGLPTFSLRKVIIYVKQNFSASISEYNSTEDRHTLSIRVKCSHVATTTNTILEPHWFCGQLNVFKYVVQLFIVI